LKTLVPKLLQVLSLVAAMIFASQIVLAVVLYFAGVLTCQKAADVVKVVQGRLVSPPEEPAKVERALEPYEIKSQQELQQAVADWQTSKKQQEDALAAERQAIESMKRELETVRLELDAKETQLQKRTADFESAKAAEDAAARDKGFQDAVATYSAMETKDVAQLLYGLTDDVVVRYLKAFKTGFRAEVLTQIKKFDEQYEPAAPGKINRAARLQEMIRGDAAAVAAAG